MRVWVFVLLLVLVGAAGVAVIAQGQAKYAGVDNCKMCHPDTFTDWSKTSHAKAFELLVNVGQEKNTDCLACHSTGYGKGGFVDEATTPGLKGVACESCHGPGADHMGDKTKIQRVPSGATCAACHQKNNIHSMPGK
jgi:hypothetical protein